MSAPSISRALQRAAVSRPPAARSDGGSGVLTGRIVDRLPVPLASSGYLNFNNAPFSRVPDMGMGLDAYPADATMFAIVSGSAETCSQVCWTLYRKSADGDPDKRTPVPPGRHPSQILWDRPNAFMTGQEFREAGFQHFECTGEWDWVMDLTPGFPVEMWPVRPDRLRPVKSPSDYLNGWTYVFDGQEIPLETAQVLQVKRPSPLDAYRGMAPVVAAMRDVDTNRLAAEWSRNFFYNSALPTGVIQYDQRLEEWEFKQILSRWREQHKGTANAHRVGIVEGGTWVPTTYSVKDMDFSAMRELSGEQIRLAYRFPKPILGSVDDVNLANAKAAQFTYGEWFLTPRLVRLREAMNQKWLPLFGDRDAQIYEWDFESPVPSDEITDAQVLTAKAAAAQTLIALGYDHEDVEKYLDLPAMRYTKPAPAPVHVISTQPGQPGQHADPGGEPAPADEPQQDLRQLGRPPRRTPRAIRGAVPAEHLPPDQLPALDDTQRSWSTALAALLVSWAAVTATQTAALLALVRELAAGGNVAGSSGLIVPADLTAQAATGTLAPAMTQLASEAVTEAAVEASAQGVELPAVVPDPLRLQQLADAYSDQLARSLGLSAAGEATRLYRRGVTADELEQGVRDHLDALTDARERLVLGGALTAAQNSGRMAAFSAGALDHRTVPAYYANETLDKNTCVNCRDIAGKWLGNDLLKDVAPLYPTGGYAECLGGLRCRGMVSAIWRPSGD